MGCGLVTEAQRRRSRRFVRCQRNSSRRGRYGRAAVNGSSRAVRRMQRGLASCGNTYSARDWCSRCWSVHLPSPAAWAEVATEVAAIAAAAIAAVVVGSRA
jgi:hypothetical protein